MGTFWLLVDSFGSLFVLWSAVCAVNHMCRHTAILIRLGYIGLGVSALSSLIEGILYGMVPPWELAATHMCIAILALGSHTKFIKRLTT